MAPLTPLMAGFFMFAGAHGSDVADRPMHQGFLSQYMGSDTSKTSLDDYNNFVTPQFNHMKHGPKIVDKEEQRAVQKVLATDNSMRIGMSAIGVSLLTLAAMLGVRMRRGQQQATAFASSGGHQSDISIALEPAAASNILELKTQESTVRSQVGWSQQSPVQQTNRSISLTPCMAVVKPGDFKNGLTIERDGGVWKVLSFQQTKTARQAAMVRTKLKNLVSGTTVEDTFRMTETFQTAQVDTNDAIYSYEDGDSLVFMDAVEFDEMTIQKEKIENVDLVKDGMTVQIVKWGDVIVEVQLPTSETYEVTYTEPGLKNAASTGQSKDATLETGAVIQVPLFVEIGDVVKVKCADREFMERAKK